MHKHTIVRRTTKICDILTNFMLPIVVLCSKVVILLVQFDWTYIFDSKGYLYGNISADNFARSFWHGDISLVPRETVSELAALRIIWNFSLVSFANCIFMFDPPMKWPCWVCFYILFLKQWTAHFHGLQAQRVVFYFFKLYSSCRVH